MTDPFKNPKLSFNNQSSSSPSLSNSYNPRHYLNAERKLDEQERYVPSYSYAESLVSKGLKEQEDTMSQYPFKTDNFAVRKINEQEQNQDFAKTYIETNRESIIQLRSYIELLFKGVRIAGQIGFYPLKVLRWKCQIHPESHKYHLTPFTLMPIFYNLGYNGYVTLWKGCFSMAAFTGIKMILESVIGEFLSFEKNLDDVNRVQKFYGHVLLKFLVSAITTPIFSAVIFESVQSGIVNENLGLVDLLKETWNRITGYKYNYRTRLLPFWSLILPTCFYSMGVHFLSYALEKVLRKLILYLYQLLDERRKYGPDEVEIEVIQNPYLNTLTQVFSEFGAIIALYPIETILNRIIVQGTRTIIDNTDNGYGVIPINTNYEGFIDCARVINETEGFLGFYKGIGAFMIESMLFFGILKVSKLVALRIYDSEWVERSNQNNVKHLMTSHNSPSHQSNQSTISSLSPRSELKRKI